MIIDDFTDEEILKRASSFYFYQIEQLQKQINSLKKEIEALKENKK